MKKIISALLISALFFLYACDSGSEKTPEPSATRAPKYADMLNITSKNQLFSGSADKFNAVLSAVKNKVQILEREHNKTVEKNNSEAFFLDDSYLLTLFEPFLTEDFHLTDGFDREMNSEKAKEYYASESNNEDIQFKKEPKGYVLLFVGEEISREYSVEYSSDTSFRYISRTEGRESTVMNEMIEFREMKNNAYIIQSQNTRLYVQFDFDGNILYFRCASLKNGTYGLNESIYPKAEHDKAWVTDRDKSEYQSIHTYENGALTHEDCSSGPWKEVTIYESEFANAFPQVQ